MAWASALLGKTLLVKDTDGKSVAKPTEEVLKSKKYVALYFSAHVRTLIICTKFDVDYNTQYIVFHA